jgi:cellulose synthase/poly-beta-1,6-N-acetylglucosamine synthase-like glycosyltransferase
LRVSVIATVLNEADSVEQLVRSLWSQSRPPDEIIISDAGSTDGTRSLLQRLSAEVGALRVVDAAGNRSRGRNTAIEATTGEIIACTDGGCKPQADWLEQITKPFTEGASFVGGFYQVDTTDSIAGAVGLVMVPTLEEVDVPNFLPSTRSMAFLRSAWAEVGGFPEELDFAEDTVFDQRMIEQGHRPVFAPQAIVVWQPPRGYGALIRTMFRWGRGDGQARAQDYWYKRLGAVYGGTALLVGLGLILGPRWAATGLVPLAVKLARQGGRRFKQARGPSRYLLIPLAHAASELSWLAGYTSGSLGRQQG